METNKIILIVWNNFLLNPLFRCFSFLIFEKISRYSSIYKRLNSVSAYNYSSWKRKIYKWTTNQQGILVAHRCRIQTEASTTRSCWCSRRTGTLARHRNQPYIRSSRWDSQALLFGARHSKAELSSDFANCSSNSSGSLWNQ